MNAQEKDREQIEDFMQNSLGEWRRMNGEWRHSRYGSVRINAERQWVFLDFTGAEGGPFATAADARAGLLCWPAREAAMQRHESTTTGRLCRSWRRPRPGVRNGAAGGWKLLQGILTSTERSAI
ncbi:hypothetical protein [Paraburkholderia youngii]|uniref:hypothetical protein n=1 Tax=Paraburkholderia youngii TaxID=2782701 RepID=UPI003D251F1E